MFSYINDCLSFGLEKLQFIAGLETFVAGNDDLFAGHEAVRDFVISGILPSDADVAPIGMCAVRTEDENPFASGHLIECAFRDDDAFSGLAQLKVDVVALSAAYAVLLPC